MINTVGDLIGALQRHQNSQLVKVSGKSIQNVIAPNTTGTVQIYLVGVPNPSTVAVVSSTTSSPRLEED